MKLIALSILLILNIYSQEKMNFVVIHYIDGDTVDYSFEAYGTDHMTDFGSFIVVIENDKGTIIKTLNIIPHKYEGIHLDTILFKGKFRIIFYDFKKKLLAKSDFFAIPNKLEKYRR